MIQWLLHETSHEVIEGINKLSSVKALDDISSEHLKYSSERKPPPLTICFSGLVFHGLLPDSVHVVLLVRLVKQAA